MPALYTNLSVGETNLEIDWKDNPADYECTTSRFEVKKDLRSDFSLIF